MAAPPSYDQANAPGYMGYNQAPPPRPGNAPGQPGYPPGQPGYPPQNQSGYPPNTYVPPSYPPSHQGQYQAPPQQPPASVGDAEIGFTSRGLANDKIIRHRFIRKVYLIIFAQLLLTFLVICFFRFVRPVHDWVRTNSWFYYLSYATFLVTYIVLVCCPTVRRKWPGNFIALFVFTLAFSYMVGTICTFYDVYSVLIAAGITTLVCLGISLFAMQTRIDFTMCTGFLFVISLVFFLFGISCGVVYATLGPNYILQCVYAGVGCLVFGLFLAYDTQMVMGGKNMELSEEEYIFGAMQIYLDVVYIFLMILGLFSNKN